MKRLSTKTKLQISIIIPTKNRTDLLQKTLDSVVRQVSSIDEVIIVDSSSTNQTKNLISQYAKTFPIQYAHESRIGPSYARNVGVRMAKHQGLVFLDDDCMPSKNWLLNIRQILSSSRAKIVYKGSLTHVTLSKSLYADLFHLRVALEEKIKYGGFKKRRIIDFLHTNNLFALRTTLEPFFPLFDEKTFPFIGEERDLAYRLQTHGVLLQYEPGVHVFHTIPVVPSVWQLLLISYQYGRAEGILNKRYKPNESKIRKLFPNEYIKPNNIRRGLRRLVWERYRHQPLLYIHAIVYMFLTTLIRRAGNVVYSV